MKKFDKQHTKFQLIGFLGYGIIIFALLYFAIPWWGWLIFGAGFVLIGTMASHNIRRKIYEKHRDIFRMV